MDEAAVQAGIEFDDSVWSVVPEEVEVSAAYQYREGAARVVFENEEQNFRLVIAKTDYTLTGEELTDGEYYEEGSVDYTDPVIGYKGSDGMINVAVFETENYRYAITYEWGEDGSGLTEEELVELVYTLLGMEMPDAAQDAGAEETPVEQPAENPEAAPAETYAETPQAEYVDPASAGNAETPQETYEETPQETAGEVPQG